MKIPRDVSGTHLANVLCRRWQYAKVHQVGSHIILETSEPTHQRIAIPEHDPVRLGTLTSILRAVAQHKGVTRNAIIATLWSFGERKPTCGE
jgi:predicted RNA binding protein YcfA (HicA-like mRNA interferase family)